MIISGENTGQYGIDDCKVLTEKWMMLVKQDETNMQVSQKWDNQIF